MGLKSKFNEVKHDVNVKWLKFKFEHPKAAHFVQQVPYIFAGAVVCALGTAAVEHLENRSVSSNSSDAYDDGYKDGINFALDGVVRSTEYSDRELYEAFKENGVKIGNTK